MAEPIGDEENQRNVQGSTPGEVLAILVISLFLHVVLWAWLALLAMVPIVIVQIMIREGKAGPQWRRYKFT